jgi:integrase
VKNIPYLQSTTSRGVTYYRYLLSDGSYEALGKNAEDAERSARALNRLRAAKSVTGGIGNTMLDLIDFYEPIKLRSSNSVASRKAWSQKLKAYRLWMGDWKVSRISVQDLDTLLAEKAPLYDPYRLHRLLLGELFTMALGKGWRKEVDGNPGKALLPPRLSGRAKSVKVRKRLTLPQYEAIYRASPAWMQLAMSIALHIGIRRQDVCTLKLEQFKEGYLFFIPSKTADLPNPAAIKVKLDNTLKELLTRSRNLSPLSPFFLHMSHAYRGAVASEVREHRTQVLPEQLTRHFKHIRDKVAIENPDLFRGSRIEERGTYHEIRSLCTRTHRAEGKAVEDIQVLLGHGDVDMTEYYNTDPDKVTWQEVEV